MKRQKKMKKVFSVISLILCVLMLFTCCAHTQPDPATPTDVPSSEPDVTAGDTTETPEKPVINVGFLKGPTGMGAAYLLEQDALGTANAEYNCTLAAAADVLQASLISGELDIAALPTNAAAVLHKKTEGAIDILAVNTLGVIYIMSNEDITSVADLKGMTILSAGQGTTTEYVLDYILSGNGLIPGEDVTVEYASEHAEVVSKAAAGNYSVILLPEPFVTQMKAQSADFSTVIDLTEEWEKLGGGLLTMGCVAVRKDFAENAPEAVGAFLADYKASVDFVNANTEEAAALIEKYEIAKASVAAKALPACNITFMTGDEMKQNVSAYLTVLADYAPAAVGGELPGDDFYRLP